MILLPVCHGTNPAEPLAEGVPEKTPDRDLSFRALKTSEGQTLQAPKIEGRPALRANLPSQPKPVWFPKPRMKTKIILLLTLFLIMGVSPRLRGEENPLIHPAIRLVESQNNPKKVGKLGELGAYQFMKNTWYDLTNASFRLAQNPEVAEIVAKRHLSRIAKELQRNGINPTNYNLALAWNAGTAKVLRGTAPARSHDYAQRVVNTMESLRSDPRNTTQRVPKPRPLNLKISQDPDVVFGPKDPPVRFQIVEKKSPPPESPIVRVGLPKEETDLFVSLPKLALN